MVGPRRDKHRTRTWRLLRCGVSLSGHCLGDCQRSPCERRARCTVASFDEEAGRERLEEAWRRRKYPGKGEGRATTATAYTSDVQAQLDVLVRVRVLCLGSTSARIGLGE